jgi:two-component system chemotaxis response regulator CheB
MTHARFGGNRKIGVVVSGQLDDGSRGLAAINQAGGHVMVIRRSDDTEKGMPEHAADLGGPIDCIGNTDEIVHAIIEVVRADQNNLKTTRTSWTACARAYGFEPRTAGRRTCLTLR